MFYFVGYRFVVSELNYKMEYVLTMDISIFLNDNGIADKNLTIFEETRIALLPCGYQHGFLDTGNFCEFSQNHFKQSSYDFLRQMVA